jgi:hypothetical protein
MEPVYPLEREKSAHRVDQERSNDLLLPIWPLPDAHEASSQRSPGRPVPEAGRQAGRQSSQEL